MFVYFFIYLYIYLGFYIHLVLIISLQVFERSMSRRGDCRHRAWPTTGGPIALGLGIHQRRLRRWCAACVHARPMPEAGLWL